jgi:vesicle coat complex subunit
MSRHTDCSLQHVAPKKPVEEEIKVTSDVVADSPHKVTSRIREVFFLFSAHQNMGEYIYQEKCGLKCLHIFLVDITLRSQNI